MNDAPDSVALTALYQKLMDVLIADDSARDPHLAVSALAHALITTASAAGFSHGSIVAGLMTMMREDVLGTRVAPDPDPVPLHKLHDC